MPTNFEKTEHHVAQSLKEHPDSTKAFSKELHDMQRCETPSAFKQDMGKLNDDLHKQGLLPGLQIVDNEKTHEFELKKNGGAGSDGQKAAPKGSDSTLTQPAKPGDSKPPEKPELSATPERAPGSVDRSQFYSQLKDPKVMAAFAGRMNSEVGSQGPEAQTAFAEEIMNRAASRDQTLMQTLSGSYYPTPHPGSSEDPKLVAAITNAYNKGSDITHGATGNATGHVGFGAPGGGYDAQHNWVSTNQTGNFGGERVGYEQTDLNKGWMQKYQGLKQGHRELAPN